MKIDNGSIEVLTHACMGDPRGDVIDYTKIGTFAGERASLAQAKIGARRLVRFGAPAVTIVHYPQSSCYQVYAVAS